MASSVSTADDHTLEGRRITLRALIAARWVLLLILIAAGFAGRLVPGAELDGMRWFEGDGNTGAAVITVGLWIALNLATRVWLGPLTRPGNLAAGLHLLIDTVGITLVLVWSGGAANPFTVLYFVPITLATQVSPRWTWIVAGASVLFFGALLFAGSGGEGAGASQAHHAAHAAHAAHVAGQPAVLGGSHYEGHLRGMWLALGLSGALITYFVHRIATAISHQRAELARLREQAERDRALLRVGSLAAGAAHELGTPLATLTILAGELDHMSDRERGEATRAMRGELARCKEIIGAMATPALRADVLHPEDVEPWPLDALDDGGDPQVRYDFSRADRPVSLAPQAALEKIIGELVANAKAASPPGTIVRVSGVTSDAGVELRVEDDGEGMSAEVASAATDPFFSTKDGVGNMGLGLFLVEAQVRTLGGRLTIHSVEARGTVVTIALPAPRGGA